MEVLPCTEVANDRSLWKERYLTTHNYGQPWDNTAFFSKKDVADVPTAASATWEPGREWGGIPAKASL